MDIRVDCRNYLIIFLLKKSIFVKSVQAEVIKVKPVPVLLSENHAMKVYWRSGGIAPRIL